MKNEQIITQGKDGKYYNQYGSLVYINVMNAAKNRWANIKKPPKPRKVPKIKFREFEIHAKAYINLLNIFNDNRRVRGEYSLGNLAKNNYCRADIVILDKQYKKPLIIIEVKRNKNKELISTKQINNYYNFCDTVILVSSMEQADNIVNIIKKFNIE